MNVQKHTPKFPLSNFIEHIVYVSGSLPIPFIKELPDGGINLVIELNDKTVNTIYQDDSLDRKNEVKHAWISGVQKQAILYKNNTDSTIISVRFTAGGFFCLTKIPITEIHEAGIDAQALLGNSFANLYQQILNAASVAEKFSFIENYFLRYQTGHSTEQEVVRFIDQNIDKPIDWLVHKSGYSQKHVIHLLKKHTGFSPKFLQRLNRFQLLVKEIQNQKSNIDWFSAVHRHGYYDQAHLIKDFAHFSGITPTEYLTSQLAIEENSHVSDMILKLPS